jgi:hypothetical protein
MSGISIIWKCGAGKSPGCRTDYCFFGKFANVAVIDQEFAAVRMGEFLKKQTRI